MSSIYPSILMPRRRRDPNVPYPGTEGGEVQPDPGSTSDVRNADMPVIPQASVSAEMPEIPPAEEARNVNAPRPTNILGDPIAERPEYPGLHEPYPQPKWYEPTPSYRAREKAWLAQHEAELGGYKARESEYEKERAARGTLSAAGVSRTPVFTQGPGEKGYTEHVWNPLAGERESYPNAVLPGVEAAGARMRGYRDPVELYTAMVGNRKDFSPEEQADIEKAYRDYMTSGGRAGGRGGMTATQFLAGLYTKVYGEQDGQRRFLEDQRTGKLNSIRAAIIKYSTVPNAEDPLGPPQFDPQRAAAMEAWATGQLQSGGPSPYPEGARNPNVPAQLPPQGMGDRRMAEERNVSSPAPGPTPTFESGPLPVSTPPPGPAGAQGGKRYPSEAAMVEDYKRTHGGKAPPAATIQKAKANGWF